jgi:hypothetical protein
MKRLFVVFFMMVALTSMISCGSSNQTQANQATISKHMKVHIGDSIYDKKDSLGNYAAWKYGGFLNGSIVIHFIKYFGTNKDTETYYFPNTDLHTFLLPGSDTNVKFTKWGSADGSLELDIE